MWRNDPTKFCCLVEDYYSDPNRASIIEDRRDRIEVCIRNFFASTTLDKLHNSRPSRWLALDDDPFTTANVDGIEMYGRPDLGYGVVGADNVPKHCYVFDWKTAGPRPDDVKQMHYYVLFATSVWGFPQELVSSKLIYLFPELREVPVKTTGEDLAKSIENMRMSYDLMRAKLPFIVLNRATDLTHFPVTERTKQCPRCNFQEICTDRLGYEQTEEADQGVGEDSRISGFITSSKSGRPQYRRSTAPPKPSSRCSWRPNCLSE